MVFNYYPLALASLLSLVGWLPLAAQEPVLTPNPPSNPPAASPPAPAARQTVIVPGPAHEALAPWNARPVEAPWRVARQPPLEQPPLERPPRPAEDVVWIDGYWDWHAPRSEFVWVPGMWRRVPPNLSWQPGKWVAAPDGAVRYPGYFFHADQRPTLLSTAPPDDPAQGGDRGREATARMVGQDAFWVRGSWQLDESGQYQWQPGFVAAAQPDAVWQPGRVVPVAGGFSVLPGYWDYPSDRRGEAYAALRQPIPPQTPLQAIDTQSLTRTYDGRWNYTQLRTAEVAAGPAVQVALVLPDAYPRRLDRGLLVDGSGTIVGTVRKGKLTPDQIQIRLMGGAVLVTESNEDGRFLFEDVPYGRYTLLAEGPVQNYHRQGAAYVDVEQPTVEVEIELE